MEADNAVTDNAKAYSDNKFTWITPDIIELSVKNTSNNDYYQDDGFGPGASLS